MRRFLSVIAGVLLALAITYVIETVNSRIYPPPPGTVFSDPESVKAMMAVMPKTALGVVLFGWALAALAGTWLAARLARPSGWPPLTVGIVLLAAAVMNMYMIPHPLWFWLIGVAIYPVATWIGARLGGTPVKRAG